MAGINGSASGDSAAVAVVLHRITRVYGLLAVIVPIVGFALAAVQGRLTEIWVVLAMVLTAVAGALLALRIAPAQRDALRARDGSQLRSLRMTTGIFTSCGRWRSSS